MSTPIRIGLIAEDSNFASLLTPLVVAVANELNIAVRVLRAEVTSGCQHEALRRAWERLVPQTDLLIVGADAGGAWHRSRSATFRQKARNLQALIPILDHPVVWAVAHPSIEAWLMADSQAVRSGLKEALELPIHSVDRWPVPRTERDAKRQLAQLVQDLTGDVLPRDGFECAEEVVRHAGDLSGSTNDSLAECVRALKRVMSDLVGP